MQPSHPLVLRSRLGMACGLLAVLQGFGTGCASLPMPSGGELAAEYAARLTKLTPSIRALWAAGEGSAQTPRSVSRLLLRHYERLYPSLRGARLSRQTQRFRIDTRQAILSWEGELRKAFAQRNASGPAGDPARNPATEPSPQTEASFLAALRAELEREVADVRAGRRARRP